MSSLGSLKADPALEFNRQSICLNDLADLLKAVDENSLVAITDPNGRITHVNTSILGNCGIAGMTVPADSPALPFLDKIEQTVQRAAMLTNQLLAFTGRGPWLPILLELNTFVRDMEGLLDASVPKGVHVQMDPAEALLHVRADPSQLHQIIFSLVNNAAEAIGEDRDGAILLRLDAAILDDREAAALLPQTQVGAGRYAVLEVSDSGCGMAPGILSRIFDPFFTTKFTGRGLGLSAVLGILRAWEGGITVESSPGTGSTFRVFLPLEDPEAALPKPERPAGLGLHLGTVLFVDDEPMLRECGAEVLACAGFEVLQAKDGVEALEAYRARMEEISVVIMDLTMPRLGGLEATARLRELNPGARVILSSGYSDQVLAESLGPLKADAFLQKPYTLEVLRDAVLRVHGAGS